MVYKKIRSAPYTTAKRRRFRRRFYFDARIGKNVPIIGGTGIRFGKRAMRKVARSEIMRNEETKIWATTEIASNVLTQNTMYTLSPIQGLIQGVAENQRVGQQVFMRHLKIRGSITNNVATPSVYYRVLVCWLDEQFVQGWAFVTGQINQPLLFYGSGNLTTALLNNKTGAKVICDRYYYNVAQYSGNYKIRKFSIDCPLFEKVTFNTTGVLLNQKQLYVVIIPFTPGGINDTTAVGELRVSSILSYKDA